MFEINININALFGIAIIAVVLLFAMIFMFIAYMCHDKRKFKSIDKYNELVLDKSNTYNENLKEYDDNVKKSGAKFNTKSKLKVISSIIKLFKKGSE